MCPHQVTSPRISISGAARRKPSLRIQARKPELQCPGKTALGTCPPNPHGPGLPAFTGFLVFCHVPLTLQTPLWREHKHIYAMSHLHFREGLIAISLWTDLFLRLQGTPDTVPPAFPPLPPPSSAPGPSPVRFSSRGLPPSLCPCPANIFCPFSCSPHNYFLLPFLKHICGDTPLSCPRTSAGSLLLSE